MLNERNENTTSRHLRVARSWLVVDEHGLRARDTHTSILVHENVFAVVILWEVPAAAAGSWIGWLTTVNHCSACFYAADAAEPRFQDWLARLPGWEPSRLHRALEIPGLHLVWRCHVE